MLLNVGEPSPSLSPRNQDAAGLGKFLQASREWAGGQPLSVSKIKWI